MFNKKESKGDFEVKKILLFLLFVCFLLFYFFQVLEKAAEQIKEQLKNEEKFPDLRERLTINSSNASQQYYLEPYQNECGSMVIYLFSSL